MVFKQEISAVAKSVIPMDQFAYKEGTNTTTALIKCQHHWLKWLDEDSDFARVMSFDSSKAFDSVPHDIVREKLKSTSVNPYIINWIISFFDEPKTKGCGRWYRNGIR